MSFPPPRNSSLLLLFFVLLFSRRLFSSGGDDSMTKEGCSTPSRVLSSKLSFLYSRSFFRALMNASSSSLR